MSELTLKEWPKPGTSVYWRFKGHKLSWSYRYVVRVAEDLFRMGLWNRDTSHGLVVSMANIEWHAKEDV